MTPERAYILGYIYADGCITGENDRVLRADSKDLELVRSVQRVLGRGTVGKREVQGKTYFYFVSNTNGIREELSAHGIVRRKSKKALVRLPISDDLFSHWLRGFFDGDGCVGTQKRKDGYTGVYFNLGAGNRETLVFLREKISSLLGIRKPKVVENKQARACYVTWSSRQDLTKLYEFLYADATVFLGRKKLKFNETQKLPKAAA